jgi:hypothetical protein
MAGNRELILLNNRPILTSWEFDSLQIVEIKKEDSLQKVRSIKDMTVKLIA